MAKTSYQGTGVRLSIADYAMGENRPLGANVDDPFRALFPSRRERTEGSVAK